MADCSHSLLNRLEVQGELGSETNGFLLGYFEKKLSVPRPSGQ